MRFGVLGPLVVVDDDGVVVDVGGPQPRLVLVALIAAGDRPVGVDALIELLWGEEPPISAAGTLQTYVSRIRRVIEPVHGARLSFDNGAYRLELPPGSVDLGEFETLADTGLDHLTSGRLREARDSLAEALATWRGPALVELTDRGASLHRAAALEERRLAVLEMRLDADLALGHHEVVIGDLRMLAADHPLREGLHARLALALYRSGRQTEALRVLAAASATLRDELGLEPGRQLVDLERAILDHDPSLDASTSVAIAGQPTTKAALVGRDAEMSVLVAAYTAAADDAQFVVVEGEPGIGKSRLTADAVRSYAASGSPIAWARSDEVGVSRALWPWLDVVRAVRARVDDVPPALDELLSDAASPSAPSNVTQLERFEAVAELLERCGTGAPVVVVLDDLQWFDPASLNLLQFLVTRLDRGVLTIATLRTPEIGRVDALTDTLSAIARRPGSRRLRLAGLPREAIGELLAGVSIGQIDDDRTDHIHDRSDGNPFYAIELARFLHDAGGDDDDVPATIADTVRRRVQQLGHETFEMLIVAAVVGREIDVPLVATVADVDLAWCAEQLDQAAAHRVLIAATPTRLRFAHALVREVLLDGVTPLRRATLHLRVADAMEAAASSDIEVVAEHLWRASALGVGERAAAALERAAELAIGRVAYSSAEALLKRAVELRRASTSAASPAGQLATLDAEMRLITVMRATRYFSGTDRALLQRTQALADEVGRDEIARELIWSEWAAASRSADVAGARSIADRYRERWASSPSPGVRASASIIDGVTQWSLGAVSRAATHLDQALEWLRDDGAPDAGSFDRELVLLGHVFGLYCHAARGDTSPEDALAAFDDLIADLPDRVIDGRHQIVYALACRVAAVHTRWPTLERLVRQAVELNAAGQFAFFGGQVRMYQALLEARRHDFDIASTTFHDGRTRFRDVGGRTGVATCQALLAQLMAQGGRVDEARTLVVAARAEVIDTGEAVNDVHVHIAEAFVAAAAGDPVAAAQHLADATRIGDEQGAHADVRRAHEAARELGLALPPA